MLDYWLRHPQIAPGGLLFAAFAATLLAAARSLPAQNVLASAALIGVLATVIEMFGAKTGIPFGRFSFTGNMGLRMFGVVPWPMPCIWVIVVLNCRGLARLILRRRRSLPNAGLWTLALSCALAVLFDACLEPFAAQANHYWIWRRAVGERFSFGAPWTNFAGWFFSAAAMLIVSAPWLIDKKAAADSPPRYHALWIWLVLTLFLAMANAANQFWPAAFLGVATAVIGGGCAWKNSRD